MGSGSAMLDTSCTRRSASKPVREPASPYGQSACHPAGAPPVSTSGSALLAWLPPTIAPGRVYIFPNFFSPGFIHV